MRLYLTLAAAPLLCACAPEPRYFEPAVFYVEGVFGYDATADTVVAYGSQGSVVPPTIAVTVASDDWFDGFDDADRCSVVLRHLGDDALPRPVWLEEADAWVGFDLPATADVVSDCADWDPVWGDPSAAVASWEWGLALAPIDEEVTDEVRAAVIAADGEDTWDETWVPSLFGGGFRWSGATDRFDGGYAPNGYAFGLVVDDAFEVVVVDGSLVGIAAVDVVDGTPPAGAYVIEPWFGIDARLLAPTNL